MRERVKGTAKGSTPSAPGRTYLYLLLSPETKEHVSLLAIPAARLPIGTTRNEVQPPAVSGAVIEIWPFRFPFSPTRMAAPFSASRTLETEPCPEERIRQESSG